MIRALSKLLGAITLCVAGLPVFLYNEHLDATALETERVSRVELQRAQQLQHIVADKTDNNMMESLMFSRAELDIELALYMQQLSDSGVVSDFLFHQTPLKVKQQQASGSLVEVMTLSLEFVSNHVPQAIELLNKVVAGAGVWPVEIRACRISRSSRNSLSIGCVAHVYYGLSRGKGIEYVWLMCSFWQH